MSWRGELRASAQTIVRRFQAGDETAFRLLNEQWIERYFKIEAKDQSALSDPRKTIIEPGGAILLATVNGRSVGCCALLRISDHEFEVAKARRVSAQQLQQGAYLPSQADAAVAQELEAQNMLLQSQLEYAQADDELTDAIGHTPL